MIPQDFYRYSVLEVMDELGIYDDYNFIKIMEIAPTIFEQLEFDYSTLTYFDEEEYFNALLEVAEVMCASHSL